MNFQEQLTQQLAQQNQGDREQVEYPSSKLKEKELFFPKTNPSTVIIRILPPATPGENYNVPTRELFMQTRNHNGKDLKLNAVLSATPNPEDILDQNIVAWQAQKKVPSMFPDSRPTSKYYVNCVQLLLNPQTQQFEYELNAQGGLAIRLFKLSHTACQQINTALSQPQFRPAELQNADPAISQYSFISSLSAFPVSITKPQKGSGVMQHNVNVMSNMPLGALPQGWESQLEDLHYQATPSIEYNKEYVEYFINVVNGVEPINNTGAPHPATQGYDAMGYVPQQPVMQQGYSQQMQQPMAQPQATNMGTPSFGQTNMGTPPTMQGGFTQPVQSQPAQMQGQGQPAPMPQVPMQGQQMQQPVTNPAPAVQQPVAPIADPNGIQMPMQNASIPDPSSISDAGMATPVTQAPVQPNVQPATQPVQSQPVPPVATQGAPAQTPPPVQTTSQGLPDIDALIKGM